MSHRPAQAWFRGSVLTHGAALARALRAEGYDTWMSCRKICADDAEWHTTASAGWVESIAESAGIPLAALEIWARR